MFRTSWGNEPYNRGSYSFFPVGARDDDIYNAGIGAAMEAPGEQHEEERGAGSRSARVLFAGEATSVEYEGSMHGGYLSGVRAADDVAYSFGISM